MLFSGALSLALRCCLEVVGGGGCSLGLLASILSTRYSAVDAGRRRGFGGGAASSSVRRCSRARPSFCFSHLLGLPRATGNLADTGKRTGSCMLKGAEFVRSSLQWLVTWDLILQVRASLLPLVFWESGIASNIEDIFCLGLFQKGCFREGKAWGCTRVV